MATKRPKRAVLFDFDGVVADSWALHERSWAAVLKAYNVALPDNALQRSIGCSSVVTAKLVIEEAGIEADPMELGSAKSRWFAEHANEVSMMPGVVEAIDRLGEDFCLGLVAIRSRQGIDRFLNQFSLTRPFDVVVARDDIDPDATIEDVFTGAAKQLDVAPAKHVVIDDSRNGLLAAERAGMRSIAFDSNPKHDVDFSMADSVIRSLDELVPELVSSVLAR
jgi:beta-phosphoglucomutase-like phosphatase (HAD superfamily)